jgi:hypothetical protein
MSDLGLFALGLFIGFLAPAFGFFAGPAALLVLSIISGISDGKRHLRPRLVCSWAPALLGLLAFPLFLISILKEQLVEPRASHGDLTLPVVLALLSAVSVAFVAVTLAASVVTRRMRHTIGRPSQQFGGPDEA